MIWQMGSYSIFLYCTVYYYYCLRMDLVMDVRLLCWVSGYGSGLEWCCPDYSIYLYPLPHFPDSVCSIHSLMVMLLVLGSLGLMVAGFRWMNQMIEIQPDQLLLTQITWPMAFQLVWSLIYSLEIDYPLPFPQLYLLFHLSSSSVVLWVYQHLHLPVDLTSWQPRHLFPPPLS